MRRPRALTVLMWFTAVYAVGAAFGIAAVAIGLGSDPWIGGMRVTREQWLRLAAPLVAVIALLMGATSVGLLRHRRWTRLPFMCIWPLIALTGIAYGAIGLVPSALAWRAVINALVFGAGAAWLLFRYRASVEYFATLARR